MQTITEQSKHVCMRTAVMSDPTKYRAGLMGVCRCLMMSLVFAGLAHAQGVADSQASQGSVTELIDCLGVILLKDEALSPGRYLDKWKDMDVDQIEKDCAMSRVGDYHARDFASYAMGVSLQRKLLSKHDSLNWVDLLNGLLRADSSTVRLSSSKLTTALEKTLLGDAEASQQYLDEFSESRGVVETKGVFVKELADANAGEMSSNSETTVSVTDFADNMTPCDAVSETNDRQLLVKFYLVKPIDRNIASHGIVNDQIGCIEYQSDEVIRGWRLIMDKLIAGVIHDVLVPSELAYGATGVPGVVEGDENLRFLMQRIDKE